MDREEVYKELEYLYQEFPVVRKYYKLKFSGKEYTDELKQELVTRYQNKIDAAIFPNELFEGGLELDKVDRLLTSFKKKRQFQYFLEIGIYSIQQANVMAEMYGGDFGEDYYLYFEELYEELIEKASELGLSEEYKPMFHELAKSAFEGYGHYDQLNILFEEKYC
ncbi:MAG: hypothetical protein AAF694_21465 [Bacteroidota bacterium]